MTTSSFEQRRCFQCGVAFDFGAEVCPSCGHDRVFDPPRLDDPHSVSVMERMMLTMLYVEDRDPRWWHSLGRVVFLAAAAFVAYVLWRSRSA